MEKQIEKFLEFNEKEILCRKIDGQWWVAIKPICTALKISYKSQHENLTNKDHFLYQLSSDQRMVGQDGRERKMFSLPEFYIYGWLFEANAKSEEYKLYKWKCYEVLYDHFNNVITKRSRLLEDQEANKQLKSDLICKLEETKEFKQLQHVERKLKQFPKALKALDADLKAGQTKADL